MQRYQETLIIPARPEDVFAYIDDHSKFSSHMSKSSWMMGGGHMETATDEGKGRQIGSHIRMSGQAFGISVYLDEVITEYNPPLLKVWKTVGMPKLVVVGNYRMGIEIKHQTNDSLLCVFIDYDLPATNVWLGKLFGRMYAKWCVRQMLQDTLKHFTYVKK